MTSVRKLRKISGCCLYLGVQNQFPLTIQKTSQIFQNRLMLPYVLAVCLVGMTVANIVLDYLYTQFQRSSFYILESLLFSASFWMLFLPLVIILSKYLKRRQRLGFVCALTFSIITVHFLAYPAVVWVLSKAFFTHTFSYWQTLGFSLSAYFIKAVFIYGASVFIFFLYKLKSSVIETKAKEERFMTSIVVLDANVKKIVLAVEDVFYFSANPPYINIYHLSQKYLHSTTLKSLESQLCGKQFVRIHKAHIVNITKIIATQSRKNGDYDITLLDYTVLRVSRSYAKNFKLRFSEQHQLTAK